MSDQKRKAPVGSRNRKGIRAQMEVPVNLERVLIEAGRDLAFYQVFVSDPARALADRGYRLRATERAMLSAMPQTALRKMIDHLRPEKLTKSRFAKQVATAVAGTLLFSTAACESTAGITPASGGVTPEFPADANYPATRGISPNLPADASTSGAEGTGGVGGSDPVDASSDGAQTGAGGTPMLDSGLRDGDQAGSGGEPVWQADTGPGADAGISPDVPDTGVESD